MPRRAAEPVRDPVTTNLCERVRELRRQRGWSLEQLSAACDVSRSMLSQIERQRANPTLAVACRIAQALGLSLADLVESQAPAGTIDIIRAEDRSYHFRSDKVCQIRTLSPLHLEKDVEFYELLLHPEGKLVSAAHFEGTREFLTVQKGTLEVHSGEGVCQLNKGDSAHYRADLPHVISNLGRGEAVAFLVVTYRG